MRSKLSKKEQKLVKQRYRHGITVESLADDYDVDLSYIDELISTISDRYSVIKPQTREQIIRSYESGNSISSIVTEFSLTYKFIQDILKEEGIFEDRRCTESNNYGAKKRPSKADNPDYVGEIAKSIIKDYNDGFTFKQLTEKYDFSIGKVRSILDFNGALTKRIASKEKQELDDDKKNHIKALYNAGFTITDIMREVHISYEQLMGVLEDMDLKRNISDKKAFNENRRKEKNKAKKNLESEKTKKASKRNNSESEKIVVEVHTGIENDEEVIKDVSEKKLSKKEIEAKLIDDYKRGTSIEDLSINYNMSTIRVEDVLERILKDRIDDIRDEFNSLTDYNRVESVKSEKNKKGKKDKKDKFDGYYTRAEKVAYCNQKYGVGNWHFMTKQEILEALKKDNKIRS